MQKHKKIFVDTNILIDFVCNREQFYDDAETLFAMGLSGNIEISFSDISAINTLYVGRKYGFTIEELSDQLLDVLSYCSVIPSDKRIIVEALQSGWKDKEDCTQYLSARNADVIITRNVDDFNGQSEIAVMTPNEYLAQK